MISLQQLCWFSTFLIALLSAMAPGHCVSADGIQPEFEMLHDPEHPQTVEAKELDPAILPLWRQVLARPEADYQRLAAEAIATAAEAGFPDLEPAREELLQLLTAEETHPAARFTVARALIALDTRSASDALFEASQSNGSAFRLLVEPVLADWEYEPIREVWRDRVRDSNTPRRELILALNGLARVHDAEALPEMLSIVHFADRAADVRLVAARAAGAAASSGLESDAQRLLAIESAAVLHRLCAVALLSRHASQDCCELLRELSGDTDPAVAEQSLARLFAIDPELVVPLAEGAMQNADPKVRQWGVDAYVLFATPERIVVLSHMLNDMHPDVRGSVRDAFFELAARPEFNEVVRASAFEVLAQEPWRGQEQAALLLGALDHEPAGERLVDLLRSDRGEVMVASAWALRMLAIPELLPQMFAHAQHQSEIRLAGEAVAGLDEQVAHLFEAFALMDYVPADELLRRYVPKNLSNGEYSRSAAIWALGYLHAGMPDDELALQLVERMNDHNPPPEWPLVYRMSATTIGRMQAASQLEALRLRLAETHSHDQVAHAIRWSLHTITGEPIPELGPVTVQSTGWFLEPLQFDEAADQSTR